MSGSTPKPPPVITPPSKSDEEVQQAAASERARLKARKGRSSTVLSDMYGTKTNFGA